MGQIDLDLTRLYRDKKLIEGIAGRPLSRPVSVQC